MSIFIMIALLWLFDKDSDTAEKYGLEASALTKSLRNISKETETLN